MARLIYAKRALAEIWKAGDPLAAAEVVDLIEEAVAVLRRHPLLGRPVDHELRELVMSRSRTATSLATVLKKSTSSF